MKNEKLMNEWNDDDFFFFLKEEMNKKWMGNRKIKNEKMKKWKWSLKKVKEKKRKKEKSGEKKYHNCDLTIYFFDDMNCIFVM